MISTEALDQIIAQIEANPAYADKIFQSMETENELLLDFLVGTHAELLSEEELDYLLFLYAVIYHVFDQNKKIKKYTDDKEIDDINEVVWAKINELKKLNPCIDFYSEVTQEGDIMEFIELSIGEIEDSDVKISENGRIVMLCVLCSLTVILKQDSES